MRKKKIIVFLLVSMVIGIQLNSNSTIAYADVNNKVLEANSNDKSINSDKTKVENINFNKKELSIGETLEVYVDIENLDNGSSVYAHFWFPGNPLYYELKYNEELGVYTANIKIEESFNYKTLDLIGIEIRNEGGNNIKYQSNLSVTISNEKGIVDKSKPVINSVNINKNEIMVGETLEILVDATDDVSGIKAVKSSLYVNGQYKELKFSYDETKKIYKSYFEITEDLKYKTIRVSNVLVTDNADKSTTWEEGVNISVLQDNGSKDDIKPIIKSVNLDKGEYKSGDILKLYVDAYDNESGIQFVKANVIIGKYTKYLLLEYNKELKKYVGEIKISEDTKGSKITLANLTVADNSYNYTDFKDEISAYVLTDVGQVDKNSPIIDSIEFNKDKLMLKDKLEITLNSSDDISGIDEIKANITIGEENLIYGFSKIDKNNKYVLEIYTKEFMYLKNLNIKYIEAIDYAGNINKIEVNKIIQVTDESIIIKDDTNTEKITNEINTSNESKTQVITNNKDKIVDKEVIKSIDETDKSIDTINKLPDTGGTNSVYALATAFIILALGSILTLKRKKRLK